MMCISPRRVGGLTKLWDIRPKGLWLSGYELWDCRLCHAESNGQRRVIYVRLSVTTTSHAIAWYTRAEHMAVYVSWSSLKFFTVNRWMRVRGILYIVSVVNIYNTTNSPHWGLPLGHCFQIHIISSDDIYSDGLCKI